VPTLQWRVRVCPPHRDESRVRVCASCTALPLGRRAALPPPWPTDWDAPGALSVCTADALLKAIYHPNRLIAAGGQNKRGRLIPGLMQWTRTRRQLSRPTLRCWCRQPDTAPRDRQRPSGGNAKKNQQHRHIDEQPYRLSTRRQISEQQRPGNATGQR
jgi:hypothetical protein